jgi:hypothetical protein
MKLGNYKIAYSAVVSTHLRFTRLARNISRQLPVLKLSQLISFPVTDSPRYSPR